jgi:two-component system sensor histidine kinase/response regulator
MEFDLVLMDCQMPEVDGFEATRLIRSSQSLANPNIPIIALTAKAFAEDRLACLNAGMNDHLSKPMQLKELVAKIEKWLPREVPENHRDISTNREPEHSKRVSVNAGPTGAVDWTIFDALERPGGNREFSKILVESFIRTSQPVMIQFSDALKASDFGRARKAAHSIHPTCTQLGAISLGKMLKAVETSKESEIKQQVIEMLPKIEKEYGLVLAEFIAMKEQLDSRVAS